MPLLLMANGMRTITLVTVVRTTIRTTMPITVSLLRVFLCAIDALFYSDGVFNLGFEHISEKNRRDRGNVRTGRGGSDSRGWRGRESRENERNAAGPGDNKSRENNQSRRGGPTNSFRNGGFGAGRGGRSGG